jgi:transcriptional regulator with XRE-family HTH domain
MSKSMITAQQLQMARAALGWSLDVLGEKSGVSSRTIRRIESEGGLAKATAANLKLIKQTLEQAGVEFIGRADEGPGVRLWKR